MAESILVPLAQIADSDAVRRAVQRLRDTIDPDAGDAAYIAALDRCDIKVGQVGDGFQINGFVGPAEGLSSRKCSGRTPDLTARTTIVQLASVESTGSVGAVEKFFDGQLPSDAGVRPHLLEMTTPDAS